MHTNNLLQHFIRTAFLNSFKQKIASPQMEIVSSKVLDMPPNTDSSNETIPPILEEPSSTSSSSFWYYFNLLILLTASISCICVVCSLGKKWINERQSQHNRANQVSPQRLPYRFLNGICTFFSGIFIMFAQTFNSIFNPAKPERHNQ